MAVLLTAAHTASCLAVARALHARGLPVVAVGQPGSLAFYSRAVTRALIAPSSRSEPEAFARFVVEASRAHGVKLVIPLDDSSCVALDGVREELERVTRVALPSSECLRIAMDKVRLSEVAARLGVPTPPTRAVASLQEARAAAGELGYPVVVKPRESAPSNGIPPPLRFKVHFAEGWETLRGLLEPHVANRRTLLLQAYYPGLGLSLDGVSADGDILTMVSRRPLKTHPLTGILGIVRETIPLDPTIRGQAGCLLQGLRYDGLFNIQFRRCPGDGSWRLTDFNPRGAIHLGTTIRAGVDLPSIAYEWFVRRRKVFTLEYQVGMRGVGLLGNLRHTLLLLQGRDRGIDPFYPSRWEAVRDFFLDLVRARHCDEITLRDPLPGLMQALHGAWGIVGGMRRGLWKWAGAVVRRGGDGEPGAAAMPRDAAMRAAGWARAAGSGEVPGRGAGAAAGSAGPMSAWGEG